MLRTLMLASCLLPAMALAQAPAPRPIPPDRTTQQQIDLPDRSLPFRAIVTTHRITDGAGAAEADIVTTAFLLEGVPPGSRPVTFAINGGPGAGSAWLNLLALGPWRVAVPQDGAPPPSLSPALVPNAETWLGFTDLVFIDPPGTGYSRVLSTNDGVRRRLLSSNGEIPVLAGVIRRWLEANGRLANPKLLVGESYGGFRAPRLARRLAEDEGVGVSAMLLLSPILDFNNRSIEWDPYTWLTRLPVMAAANRGATTREGVADAEAYATTDYLQDFMRGMGDADATARMVDRVTALTGLDRAVVAERGGRVDWWTYRRGHDRGRIASAYDLTVSSLDPFPIAQYVEPPDAVTDALKVPVTAAAAAMYADRLGWRPEGAPAPTYQILSGDVFRNWTYNGQQQAATSVSALRSALAADPRLRVLVMHGLYDVVTPYFASKLILDQLPPSFAARARLAVLPGGHMFYTRDASRAALQREGEALVNEALRP